MRPFFLFLKFGIFEQTRANEKETLSRLEQIEPGDLTQLHQKKVGFVKSQQISVGRCGLENMGHQKRVGSIMQKCFYGMFL